MVGYCYTCRLSLLEEFMERNVCHLLQGSAVLTGDLNVGDMGGKGAKGFLGVSKVLLYVSTYTFNCV